MTGTSWLFEYYGLKNKDKEFVELSKIYIKIFRQSLIDFLGLNIPPTVEKSEDGKSEILKRKEEGEFMPLIFAIARAGYLDEVFKQLDELKLQEEIDKDLEVGDSDLDRLLEDMQFLDADIDVEKLDWQSPETRAVLEQLTEVLPGAEEVLQEGPPVLDLEPVSVPERKRRKVKIDSDG